VLEHVTVTRYVTPLREGGSLPAIVEADNLGTYVMKFRGAGQGPLALVHNVDRTWRNPNLLVWHRDIWLIDHGAALYFHHNWPQKGTADPKRPFDASEHVLRDRATALADAHAALAPRVTETLLWEVTALVPPGWFGDRGAEAYVEHLLLRAPIVPEVIRG
jgi:hypothetical protein